MKWLYELLREISGEAALQRRMAELLAPDACCSPPPTPAAAAKQAMREAAEARPRCC